jgi:hypothetical protein
MGIDSYDDYLRLLKLQPNASEKDIRASITKELRKYTQRTNSPKLELRQEAERMIKTLETAEKILLGTEGQIVRKKRGEQQTLNGQTEVEQSVDAQSVVRAIEMIAMNKGRKTQSREGTVILKRSSFFLSGINFFLEEVIHKKYEASKDIKRCTAIKGGLTLFEWSCSTSGNQDGIIKAYIEGPWAVDLIENMSDFKNK